MADSCCIVELKEIIEKMNVELSQSRAKISELDAKVREQEEENTRLTRDLKECEEKCRATQERLKFAEQKLAQFSHKPQTAAQESLAQATQSNDEALNIDSMPNEMLIKIFGYLSHNVLGQIARVSRQWNELTRSPVLWKKVDVEFHWSHCSQNTVAEYFVNKLPSCVTHLRLNFDYHRDWTEPLDFEKLSMRLKDRCPHLKMLILDSVTLSNSLSLVIDLCTVFLENVKTLAFRYSEFRQCPEKEECHSISKIEVLDLLCCEFRQYNKPPFSRMPYLNQLHIRHMSAEDIDDSWFEGDSTFLNQLHVLDLVSIAISPRIFQAIQNNGLNLTELYLCWTHLDDSYLNFNKPVFPHLQTICFRGCDQVTCEGVISFIRSCQSLQNVYVNEDVAISYAAHPFVAANKCKLKTVQARQCFARHETEDYFFELIEVWW